MSHRKREWFRSYICLTSDVRSCARSADCDSMLQPLIELQYRGAVWHQRNGRDWTVEAFLDFGRFDCSRHCTRPPYPRPRCCALCPLLAQEPIASLRRTAARCRRLSIASPSVILCGIC